MKFRIIDKLFIFGAFLLIICSNGYSQTETIEELRIATISIKYKNDAAIYSLEPLTEYDEFKTTQRLQRINELTGDRATVVFKQNKIILKLNPEKIKDEMLVKLLRSMAQSHGYDDFIVQQ